jgi:hypothetical protein
MFFDPTPKAGKSIKVYGRVARNSERDRIGLCTRLQPTIKAVRRQPLENLLGAKKLMFNLIN